MVLSYSSRMSLKFVLVFNFYLYTVGRLSLSSPVNYITFTALFTVYTVYEFPFMQLSRCVDSDFNLGKTPVDGYVSVIIL